MMFHIVRSKASHVAVVSSDIVLTLRRFCERRNSVRKGLIDLAISRRNLFSHHKDPSVES